MQMVEYIIYWSFCGLVLNFLNLIAQGVKTGDSHISQTVNWGEFTVASIVTGPFALILLLWCLSRD